MLVFPLTYPSFTLFPSAGAAGEGSSGAGSAVAYLRMQYEQWTGALSALHHSGTSSTSTMYMDLLAKRTEAYTAWQGSLRACGFGMSMAPTAMEEAEEAACAASASASAALPALPPLPAPAPFLNPQHYAERAPETAGFLHLTTSLATLLPHVAAGIAAHTHNPQLVDAIHHGGEAMASLSAATASAFHESHAATLRSAGTAAPAPPAYPHFIPAHEWDTHKGKHCVLTWYKRFMAMYLGVRVAFPESDELSAPLVVRMNEPLCRWNDKEVEWRQAEQKDNQRLTELRIMVAGLVTEMAALALPPDAPAPLCPVDDHRLTQSDYDSLKAAALSEYACRSDPECLKSQGGSGPGGSGSRWPRGLREPVAQGAQGASGQGAPGSQWPRFPQEASAHGGSGSQWPRGPREPVAQVAPGGQCPRGLREPVAQGPQGASGPGALGSKWPRGLREPVAQGAPGSQWPRVPQGASGQGGSGSQCPGSQGPTEPVAQRASDPGG